MKKLELLKGGIGLLISVGVGAITGNAIKMVQPQNLNMFKKVAVGVGSLAMANMVADKTVEYFEQQWDDAATKIKEFLNGKPKETEAETVPQ